MVGGNAFHVCPHCGFHVTCNHQASQRVVHRNTAVVFYREPVEYPEWEAPKRFKFKPRVKDQKVEDLADRKTMIHQGLYKGPRR